MQRGVPKPAHNTRPTTLENQFPMPNDSSRPGYERNPPDPHSPTRNQSISQAPNDRAVDILCGALPKLPSYFLDVGELGLDGPPVELGSIVPCSAVSSRDMSR